MIETGEIYSDKFRLSCSLYEMVEIWSMRGTELELKYIDAQGKEQLIDGIITNIYSRDGLEQLVVNNELIIPTKNIIRVDDISFSNYLQ